MKTFLLAFLLMVPCSFGIDIPYPTEPCTYQCVPDPPTPPQGPGPAPGCALSPPYVCRVS